MIDKEIIEPILKLMFDEDEFVSFHNNPEPSGFQQARTTKAWLNGSFAELASWGSSGLRVGLGIHNGKDLTHRKNEDHLGSRTYMIEFDDGTTPNTIKARIKTFGITPNLVLFTGGKSFHYIWVTDQIATRLQWKANQKALFGFFPGCDTQVDKITTSTRVIGSLHTTTNKPAVLKYLKPNRISYDDFFAKLGSPAPIVEQPITQVVAPVIDLSIKGIIDSSSKDFLDNIKHAEAFKGDWHRRLWLCARDHLHQNYTEQEFISIFLDAKPWMGSATKDDLNTITKAFSEAPVFPPRLTNFGIKQLIKDSSYYEDINDIYDTGLLLVKSDELLLRKKKYIERLVDEIYEADKAKVIAEGKDKKAYRKTSILAHFEYNPNEKRLKKNQWGEFILNTYNQPNWKRLVDYKDTANIPEFYDKLFKHLVNNDLPSYEYLLDWIANSLKTNNLTYLVAIGNEGVGKGVLGEIISSLHGDDNAVRTLDSVLKKDFNAIKLHKTFFYIDEIDLKTKEHHDRLKDFVNPYGTIEAKGKDISKAYCPINLYITANEFNVIDISGSDRRFSVLNLTETKLKDTPLIEEIKNFNYLNETSIAQLGWALLNRKITNNMLEPLITSTTQKIKDALLKDWAIELKEYLLQQPSGTTIDYKDALEGVFNDPDDKRRKIGFRKVKDVIKKYPDLFEWHENNKKGVRVIKVKGGSVDQMDQGFETAV